MENNMNIFRNKKNIFLILLMSAGSNIASGMAAYDLGEKGFAKFVGAGAPAVVIGIGAVAFAPAVPVVAAVAGVGALISGGVAVDGMRDILKADRMVTPKIELKYTDPEDGKDRSFAITGERAKDYVYRNEPLISFAPNFALQDKKAAIKENLKRELNALASKFAHNAGATNNSLTNAGYISLIDKISYAPTDSRSISSNMDTYKARLKEHKAALHDMRMLAVISQAPPQDDEFADMVSEYIARIAEASQLAISLPAYQERDDINAQFIRERNISNQLQNNLDQTQATLVRTQADLTQENQNRTMFEDFYTREAESTQLASDLALLTQQNLEQEHQRHVRTKADLTQENQNRIMFENFYTLEAQSTQLASDLALLTQQNLEQKHQRLNAALNQVSDLQQERERDTQEFSNVFEQLMVLRRDLANAQRQLRAKEEQLEALSNRAAQVSPLRRLNNELIQRLSDKKAHGQKQRDVIPHAFHDLNG